MSTLSAHGQEVRDAVIYGDDNRLEINDARVAEMPAMLHPLTAVMVSDSKVIRYDRNNVRLRAGTLKEQGYCASENFIDQTNPGSCSGFLVDEQTLVTAGHCVRDQFECESQVWAFGFNDQSIIPNNQIYYCDKLMAREQDEKKKIDYAIIRLDRKIDHLTLPTIQIAGPWDKISNDSKFAMIGHPMGLPKKITQDGSLRRQDKISLLTDLDAFGGNSGSLVINQATGRFEGILISGSKDFETKTFTVIKDGQEQKSTCQASRVLKQSSGEGEVVMRLSAIPELHYTEQDKSFIQAARENAFEMIRSRPHSVNTRDLTQNGQSAMHYLLEQDSELKTLQELILYGHQLPDLSLKDFDGYAPLHLATKNKNYQAISALARAGADMNQASLDRELTPIRMAIVELDKELLAHLIKNGARPKRDINFAKMILENQKMMGEEEGTDKARAILQYLRRWSLFR